MTNRVLFETRIGSHIWNMNTKMSDTDIFQAYCVPTKDILRDIANTRSKFVQTGGVDTAQHEIGKIVGQLIKGNLNFIIGVESPIIEIDSLELFQLRNIVKETISKNCYHSIHGMAQHNFRKYIMSGKDGSERRCNKILRILKFGEHILDGKGFIFEKVEGGTPQKVEEEIIVLNDTYAHSKLPEKPAEEPFRNWLYDVRLSIWEEEK